jgi:serine/threonine protein kinase
MISGVNPMHKIPDRFIEVDSPYHKMTITKDCENMKLVELLRDKGRLDPDPDKKYNLKCNNLPPSYKRGTELGVGSFNQVFEITTQGHTDKVLRLQKLKKDPDINKQNADIEIAGLFIQSYLSKPEKEGGLECPYICKVYEFGYYEIADPITRYSEKLVYSVIEKVDSIELDPYKRYLFSQSRDKKYGYFNLRNIFRQILEGLHCINSQNYVHLDIKEANLGIKRNDKNDINEQYEARIFDFGFAEYIPPNKPQKKELIGTIGTPGYTDPQMHYDFYDKMHNDENNFNIKSDIYSLGVVMTKQYFKYSENDPLSIIKKYDLNKPKKLLLTPKCKAEKKVESNSYVYKCDIFERQRRYIGGYIDYFDSKLDQEYPELLAILVQLMTLASFEDRITAGDALKHNWFKMEEEELPLQQSKWGLSWLLGRKGGKTRKYKFTKRKRKIKTKRKRKQLSNNKKSK